MKSEAIPASTPALILILIICLILLPFLPIIIPTVITIQNKKERTKHDKTNQSHLG